MRWIGILLFMAASLRAADGTLDEARVTLSYAELRNLLAAAQKPPALAPVIPAAVLSADYDLTLGNGIAQGTATFQLESFQDAAQIVPLLGMAAKIERVDPADAVLIQQDDRYALILAGKSRSRVVLSFSVALGSSNSGWQSDLAIAPAALSSLHLHHIKPDEQIAVENATLQSASKDEADWQLGAIRSLRISRQDKPAPTAAVADLPRTRIAAPAIVPSATNETRVVRDGGYLTTSDWSIRHESEMNWTLTLPEGCQLLSCTVDGETTSPLQRDARRLVLPLPVPRNGGETQVELSYTGRKAAFDPVRGELNIELPATPLLVESLIWNLSLPQPYETVAIQGNVDFQPAQHPGEIRLTRDLGRGDAPSLHVFYQKPENTNTK